MTSKPSLIGRFFERAAEHVLKDVAVVICHSLTPERMENLAQRNISLAELLRETRYTIPKVSALAKPGVDHLARMSDEEILTLLEEVVPANVAVLRRHPSFCRGVIRDLKAFATG